LKRKFPKLSSEFYLDTNVVRLAKALLGKVLVTQIDGEITSGIITETEAYNGVDDRASHAYGGRRTQRTEVMFSQGGVSYVYLCYGIHYLFNVVTGIQDEPHAVLVRAVKPLEGEAIMRERRNLKPGSKALVSGGPGTVTQALGIDKGMNGLNLTGEKIWIEDHGIKIPAKKILKTPRIGVDYAGEDAKLLYRFVAGI
jgi:DNA-3-methyladenine glycosylase